MTTRLIIAYGLMLLMAVGSLAAIWWNFYHSKNRSYARELAARRKNRALRGQAAYQSTSAPQPARRDAS
jgi:hypothetical protein